MEVVILAATRYSFVNQRGQEIKGTKIYYVETSQTEETDNLKGAIPAEANLPYVAFDQISKLPARYNIDFGVKLQRGKPVPVVAGIEYLDQVDLSGNNA